MNASRRNLKWAVPFLWVSVALILGGCSDSDSSRGTLFQQTIQNTSAYIEKEMEKHNGVGLSIALVSDDRIVWSQGFGLANKKRGSNLRLTVG